MRTCRVGALSLVLVLGAGGATAPLALAGAPAPAAVVQPAAPAPAAAEATVKVAPTVEEGKEITLVGDGFVTKDGSKGSVVAVKFDDGGVMANFDVTNPANGKVIGNKQVWAAVQADKSGHFEVKVPMPDGKNNQSGKAWKAGETHNVRFLTGSLEKGDQIRSVGAEFKVVAAAAPEVKASVAQEGSAYAGYWMTYKGTGFLTKDGKGSVVAVKLDGGDVKAAFDVENPVNEKVIPNKQVWAVVQADDKGEFTVTMQVPNGKNNAPGAAWKAGETHTVQFLTGGLAKNDNKRSIVSDVKVEALPMPEAKPISVEQGPLVDVPLTGGATAENARVTGKERTLRAGLYQTAYSPKHNALYVTSAAVRTEKKSSALMKVNPDTLKVEKAVETPMIPGDPRGWLTFVFGVGVDDAHDRVITTNTLSNSVAIYDANTLKLVKQFDRETLQHPREVVVDYNRNLTYITAVGRGRPGIFVLDNNNLDRSGFVLMPENLTTGMAFDKKGGRVFTVGYASKEVRVFKTSDLAAALGNNDAQPHYMTYALPEDSLGVTGISYDEETGRLYVASQKNGKLTILDRDGKIMKVVSTGTSTGKDGKEGPSGALSVTVDTEARLVFVANRLANSITVYTMDGELVQTLDSGKWANQVKYQNGKVYAVNKGGARTEGDVRDLIQVYTVKPKAEPAKPSEPAKPAPAKPSEPAKPAPAKPSEPAKPAPAKPSEPAKPAPAKPAPAKPAPAKPAPAKPAPAKPSHGSHHSMPGHAQSPKKGYLPRTGAEVGGLAALAAAFVGAGALAVNRARRLRRR